MSIDLRYDVATTVYHSDLQGIVPTSASLVLRKADGTDSALAGSVTLPTFATTTTTGSTTSSLVVSDASGFVVGDRYRVVSHGNTYVVRCDRVTGTTIAITPPLDVAPTNGSAVAALKMSASITAPGSTLIAPNYRLEWTYASASAKGFHAETAHVCRWVPDQPITAGQVRELVALAQPAAVNSRSYAYFVEVADRVRRRVELAMGATNKRVSLFGDPAAFSEVGKTLARLYLADDGIMPIGVSPDTYQKELGIRTEQEMRLVIAGLTTYDANNDGIVSEDEQKPRLFSFRVKL